MAECWLAKDALGNPIAAAYRGTFTLGAADQRGNRPRPGNP